MNEHMMPIPSMLYNAAVGGHVTNSQQIIDENLNREQNDINQETVGIVPYNSINPNGMGRIVLKKNDNFKEVVEAQTNGNTIFVIKYDFTIIDTVTVPDNCILEFYGGSISGGSILYNNTIIKTQNDFEPVFKNVNVEGNIKNDYSTPELYGWNENNSTTLNTKCINNALKYNGNVKLGAKTYTINDSLIFLYNCCIEGSYRQTSSNDNVSSTILYNENDNVFAIKSQFSTVSRGCTIKHINIISTYGIQLNAATPNPDSVQFVPKVFIWGNRIRPKNQYEGIGIEGAKWFDSIINNNSIEAYKQGIKLAISDLNKISDNRILECDECAIKLLAAGTWGSQNEIAHNDIVTAHVAPNFIAIRANDHQATIIDNYMEGYHIKGFITNVATDDEDFQYNYTSFISIVSRDNRFDYEQKDSAFEFVYYLQPSYIQTYTIHDRNHIGINYNNILKTTTLVNGKYLLPISINYKKAFTTFFIITPDIDYRSVITHKLKIFDKIISASNLNSIAYGTADNTVLRGTYFDGNDSIYVKLQNTLNFIGLNIEQYYKFVSDKTYKLIFKNVRTDKGVARLNAGEILHTGGGGRNYTVHDISVTPQDIEFDHTVETDYYDTIFRAIPPSEGNSADYIIFDYLEIKETN